MEQAIVIVGGGAAGLLAAIFCARKLGGHRVTLLEKQARVGKKLLATGNGTCNISNITADVSAYHGQSPLFVQPALRAFSPDDVMAFFSSIGVRCVVRENGRVYPLCAQASAVLDCLRMELDALGVDVRCDCSVTALRADQKGVSVVTDQGVWNTKRVLVAAGGAASTSLGGCTDGYALLTSLGHTKTSLFPSIVQIRTDKEAVKPLKGVRVDADLKLIHNGRAIASSNGEILFADYGVSGPAAMAIGRFAADWERRKQGEMLLEMDLLPTVPRAELEAEVAQRVLLPGRTLESMFTGLLQKRLGQTLIKAAGLSPLSRDVQSLSRNELSKLVSMIKGWRVPVTGSAGMNAAQVTAGGISTAEFDAHTMRSRINPYVYAAGEVLDIDGDCGGFNLQWAWASAYAAAEAMTEGMT